MGIDGRKLLEWLREHAFVTHATLTNDEYVWCVNRGLLANNWIDHERVNEVIAFLDRPYFHVNLPLPARTTRHTSIHRWDGEKAFKPTTVGARVPPGIELVTFHLSAYGFRPVELYLRGTPQQRAIELTWCDDELITVNAPLVVGITFQEPLEHDVVIDLIVDGKEE